MEINYRQRQYSSQNPGVRTPLRTTSGLNMDDQRDAQNNFYQTILRTTEVNTFLQFWRGSKRVPWTWRWRWRVRPLESRKQLTTFCDTLILWFKYFLWANRNCSCVSTLTSRPQTLYHPERLKLWILIRFLLVWLGNFLVLNLQSWFGTCQPWLLTLDRVMA